MALISMKNNIFLSLQHGIRASTTLAAARNHLLSPLSAIVRRRHSQPPSPSLPPSPSSLGHLEAVLGARKENPTASTVDHGRARRRLPHRRNCYDRPSHPEPHLRRRCPLSSLSNNDDHLCFKHRLPGEDLDALISVTNDKDLDHMMLECDRLHSAAMPTARLRVFPFSIKPPVLENFQVEVPLGKERHIREGREMMLAEIQRQMQELHSLQIAENQQRSSDEEALSRVYPADAPSASPPSSPSVSSFPFSGAIVD